jgi:hypothetical protein
MHPDMQAQCKKAYERLTSTTKQARAGLKSTVAEVSASAPNAAAPAAKAKSLPNALPSLGGTAASAAASGKTSQVCPRQDKGKAPIVQRDNAPAGGSRGTQEAVAGVCSKPAYGSGSAQEVGAGSTSQTAHVTAKLKQYHNYSHQGSTSVLRFVCAGDRREKVRSAVRFLLR